MGENSERTLTDADVEAIATKTKEKMVEDFYSNIGKGVWAVIWKVLLAALIGLAAYGSGIGQRGGH